MNVLIALTPEVTAALIALVGALISVVVTCVGIWINDRQIKSKMYANLVSGSRNTWLNEMREYIATLLAEAQKAGNDYKPKEYYVAQYQVLSRLNVTELKHKQLYESILKLERGGAEVYEEVSVSIILLSSLIFKEEWEKVKEEAKR